MWKSIRKISLVMLITLGMVFTSLAKEQTIGLLIENAKEMDGQKITLEGEVIGEILLRKDRAWVNIGDETAVIGAWVDSKEVKKINRTGDYKHHGDKIKVKGTFYRSLDEQGGEMAIKGESLQISESGQVIVHTIHSMKLLVLGLLAFAAAFFYLTRIKKIKSS